MNILFTVCGRAGSKGFKSKNMKKLLGYPLAWYPLAAIDLLSKKSGDTCHICASSDSEELLSLICQGTTVPVFPIHRCARLSTDTIAKVFVTVDCLKQSDQHFGVAHDLVVDLDITSPLRTVADIENAIQKKKSLPQTDVVFSVVPSRRSPYFNMVVRQGESENYQIVCPSGYTARQQAPQVYDMNASIYVYEREYLLRDELSHRTNSIIEMKDTAVLDIDSEEDFLMMEVIAQYLFSKDAGFAGVYQHLSQIERREYSRNMGWNTHSKLVEI